jgi:acetoacetyl-CoA reductase
MARVAIVTGGTRGIGEAISLALKDAGMTVAANYAGNDEKAKAFTERTGIKAYKWDVGDFDACAAGVAQVEAELGPVDVVVNNAGMTRDGTILKMSRDMWEDVIRINLGGCFNMAHATFPGMRSRKWGGSSISARSTARPGNMARSTMPPRNRASTASPRRWRRKARGQG